MNSVQQRRLIWVGVLCLFSTLGAWLIVKALRQNVNLFLTPTQIAEGQANKKAKIRVGGMVLKGSVKKNQGLSVTFTITDFKHALKVYYTGILPDLFKEGQGVVALGSVVNLRGEVLFLADEVLAKHDENYFPPNVVMHKGVVNGS